MAHLNELPHSSSEWRSPAFQKKTRLSSEAAVYSLYDPFENEDEILQSPARKRTKFGQDSGNWRYADHTPSPERSVETESVEATSAREVDLSKPPTTEPYSSITLQALSEPSVNEKPLSEIDADGLGKQTPTTPLVSVRRWRSKSVPTERGSQTRTRRDLHKRQISRIRRNSSHDIIGTGNDISYSTVYASNSGNDEGIKTIRIQDAVLNGHPDHKVDKSPAEASHQQGELAVAEELRSVQELDMERTLRPDKLSAVATRLLSTPTREPTRMENWENRRKRLAAAPQRDSPDLEVIHGLARCYSAVPHEPDIVRSWQADTTASTPSLRSSLDIGNDPGFFPTEPLACTPPSLKTFKPTIVHSPNSGSADQSTASSAKLPSAAASIHSRYPPRTPRLADRHTPSARPKLTRMVPPEISPWFALSSSQPLPDESGDSEKTSESDISAISGVAPSTQVGPSEVGKAKEVPDAISPWFSIKKSGVKETPTSAGSRTFFSKNRRAYMAREIASAAQQKQTLQVITPTVSNRERVAQQAPYAGLTTLHSYFTPLAALPSNFNSNVDVLAVIVSSSSIRRAKTGPRDFKLTSRVMDPSCTPLAVEVQIFRPFKDALPRATTGDAILLRAFNVISSDRKIALLSTAESAWAVWKQHALATEVDIEIRGPPVEFGEAEQSRAGSLIQWWQGLSAVNFDL